MNNFILVRKEYIKLEENQYSFKKCKISLYLNPFLKNLNDRLKNIELYIQNLFCSNDFQCFLYYSNNSLYLGSKFI